MSDKEQIQLIRALMLFAVQHQELTTALMMTLKAQGLLDPAIFETQLQESQKLWLPFREAIGTVGTEKEQSLQEFLMKFEGPVQ